MKEYCAGKKQRNRAQRRKPISFVSSHEPGVAEMGYFRHTHSSAGAHRERYRYRTARTEINADTDHSYGL